MNTSRMVSIALLILCVGLAATTFVSANHSRELAARLEQTQSELERLKAQPAKSSALDNERLRRLLNEKETAYAQLKRETGAAPSRAAGAPKTALTDPRPPAAARPGNSWLERIRQEDPARYKQIVEQREQRRRQADQWFADQLAQLDQRAQSAPSQEEAELANQIADTLARLNALRQQWQAIRELPEDARRAQADQLDAESRDVRHTLNDLRNRDRQLQLENLARSIGYSDENVIQSFVDNVTGIYTNTQYNPGGGFGGGGREGGSQPPPQQPSQ